MCRLARRRRVVLHGPLAILAYEWSALEARTHKAATPPLPSNFLTHSFSLPSIYRYHHRIHQEICSSKLEHPKTCVRTSTREPYRVPSILIA
jgi:hypothetical protein